MHEQAPQACPPMADLILASEGELPPMRLRSVRRHVADCVECQEQLDVLAQLAGPPEYLEERREARLFEDRKVRFLARLEAKRADQSRRHSRLAWLLGFVMFATLLIAIGVIVILL